MRRSDVSKYWEEGIEIEPVEGDGGPAVSGRADVVSCRGREGKEERILAGGEDDGEECGDKNAGDPMADRGVG